MTTSEQSTALATRGLSDEQIKQRIQLNRQSGWGLEKGNAAQLHDVFLACQALRLLPGDHVTLYEGKRWITVDGRVELARRNPEYRGHIQRPLSKDEKEAWGYDLDDIVIETTMRTVTNGEIKAYGRVSAAERTGQRVEGTRLNPVARHRAVELAMARSLSRCSRFAFGMTALVDEDEVDEAVRTVVQEQQQPEVIARNSAQYQQIYQPDGQDSAFDLPDTSEPAAPAAGVSEAAPESPSPRSGAASDPLDEWARHRRLAARALELKIDVPTLDQHSSKKALRDANDSLAGRISAYEAGLALTADGADEPSF